MLIPKNNNSWDAFTNLRNLLKRAKNKVEKDKLIEASHLYYEAFKQYGDYFSLNTYKLYVQILLRIGKVASALKILSAGLEHYPNDIFLLELYSQAKSVEKLIYKDIAYARGKYHFFLYQQRQKAEKVIITLGEKDQRLWSEDLYGLPFTVQEGYDYIHVTLPKNLDVLPFSLQVFQDVLTPYCENKQVYLLGTGEKGYAALYYAGAVQAKTVVASPERPSALKNSSIFLGNDKKFDCPLLSTYQPTVFYDAFDLSVESVIQEDILPFYPNLAKYTIKHSGFDVFHLLKEARVLADVLKELIKGEKLHFSAYSNKIKNTYRYAEEAATFWYHKKEYDLVVEYASKIVLDKPVKQIYNQLIDSYKCLSLFQKAITYYKQALTHFAAEEIISPYPPEKFPEGEAEDGYGVMAISLNDNSVLYTKGNMMMKKQVGIGHAILIYLFLKKYSQGNIELTESAIVSEWAARSNQTRKAMRLKKEEQIKVDSLIKAVIIENSPDALLVLAEKLYGSTREALLEMKRFQKAINLSSHSVENVSGRKLSKKEQNYTLEDLTKIGKAIFSNMPDALWCLNATKFTYKKRLFQSPSTLIAKGSVQFSYLFGENNGEGIALTKIQNRQILLCVMGAEDAFHRDILMTEAVEEISEVSAIKPRKSTVQMKENKTIKLNILGDTYFGEYYTGLRQRRGIDDALTRYGYDYSFQRLQSILHNSDYNIVNLEAALTSEKSSPLKGKKSFILKGDGHKTVQSLKRQNIHAVTLGNNHLMDYGECGLHDTLGQLETAQLKYIGAGMNGLEANLPLEIWIHNRQIIIFSGYWYRNNAHQLHDFYSIGNSPGVNCLSGGLNDNIKRAKQRNPQALVIVIPHWGVDWKKTHTLQKKYANQLIQSGADLIIGHGAHLMQDIQTINDKKVLYGIGNNVFNSNGEYGRWSVPSYSFFVQIRFHPSGNNQLCIYPIYTDNLKTFWQPYLVKEEEFSEVIEIQESWNADFRGANFEKDEFGEFISFDL